jgi:hypothetical protein
MDASTLAKSAKALILASGLIAASTVIGAAQDAPVPLGTTATVALSTWYITPPSGQALLGGHTFDLTSGNLILLANGQSVSFTGSFAGVKGAYLLLNSSNTYSYYAGSAVGQVVLTFSDGTSLSTDLIEGTNIREWRTAAGGTVSTVTAGAGSTQVWTGTAQPGMGGGAAVIDMLSIPVATAGKTLTTVTLNDTNTFGALHIQLAGLTVDWTAPTPPPTPTPTPTPTCTMNDHAGKVSATKAQNVPHCIAKGKDVAKADTEKTDTKTIDVAEKADAKTADRAAAKSSND